jgi:CubicO group peptidase (beta-lactamase class C family)
MTGNPSDKIDSQNTEGRRGTQTLFSRRRFLKTSAIGAGGFTLSAAPATAETTHHGCPLPPGGEEFKRTAPSAVAMDPEGVQKALDFATLHSAASVRVYRHNCLVETSRLDPVTEDIQNNIWSSTKGVVSMLAGRTAQLGHLDIADRIGRYIPEADHAHSRITIKQLLTQSSGLPLNWTNELSQLPPDTVRYTLALPFEDEPGTDFEYGQTTVTVLGYAIEKAVGKDLQTFAQEQLFGPIGIERDDWFWLRDRAGNTHGYAYLFMTPKDLARLGHVMLHDGRWRDQQLLPERYVRAASSPSDTNGFYGYLLWINKLDHGYTVDIPDQKYIKNHRLVESAPRDMYTFIGFLDQVIFVIPSLDMVVVRTGFPGNHTLDPQQLITAHPGEWMHGFFRILMGAVEDTNIPDPGPYQSDIDIQFDYNYFVDPGETAIALGLGPHAPEGCTVLGCENPLATKGYIQTGRDAARTAIGNVEDLLERDSWVIPI